MNSTFKINVNGKSLETDTSKLFSINSNTTKIDDTLDVNNDFGITIIIVASAITVITFLFIVAIFIDCRHRRSQNAEKSKRSIFNLGLNLTLPKFLPMINLSTKDDMTHFVHDFEEE